MKKKIVLIVEDEQGLADALKEKLGVVDADVFTAYDGEKGLGLAQVKRPDIILLDVIMPKMHGKQVLLKLREDKNLQDIPVIFLTNLEDDPELERISKEDKNCEYLTKVNTSLDSLIHLVKDKLNA